MLKKNKIFFFWSAAWIFLHETGQVLGDAISDLCCGSRYWNYDNIESAISKRDIFHFDCFLFTWFKFDQIVYLQFGYQICETKHVRKHNRTIFRWCYYHNIWYWLIRSINHIFILNKCSLTVQLDFLNSQYKSRFVLRYW